MEPNQFENHCVSSIYEVFQNLSGKWTVLVLIELLKEPQRFNQLRRNLNNVNTKGLTDTLRNLEEHQLIKRTVFPTVPVTVEYSISEKGEALAHVFEEINRWKTEWDPPVQPASAMEGQ
ncbi:MULTISPECIES: winged helix-turn-helix transcriptional regulator [Paenibacillus]|jgi:DNA-binding HxlR family transcriptional regulator|uniref:winged helix-turn-helix transcriptional regulator n=1 Tax=Paenibacillus TaxID=44249 RepID=UPI00073F69FB|nr:MULTISPECIES: helix-turn-helix domain-containing protein [Paenibacillus]MDU4697571.1 helix-turn-helix domain-containing protein [Paenibacillus sp.]